MFVAGDAAADEMTFDFRSDGGNCDGCLWIAASGDIAADSYLELLLVTAGNASGLTVYFDSDGGSLAGGLLLGETVRSLGMDTAVGKSVPDGGSYTVVPGRCLSACAFAFAGGVARYVEDGSQIGVHQFYDAIELSDPGKQFLSSIEIFNNQLLQGLILDYLIRMGVSPRLAVVAGQVRPDSMYILSERELTELALIWSPKSFSTWQIEPYGEGLVAFSKSQDLQTTLTLFCDDRGTRTLLLTEKSGAAYPREIHGSRGIKVMGVMLDAGAVSSRVSEEAVYTTFSLPGDFAPSLLASELVLSNLVDGVPRSEWFFLPVEPEGLLATSTLAFRNCV
jgi:hypothetical protein